MSNFFDRWRRVANALPEPTARKPYTIVKNEAENTAEVNLYGEVVRSRPKDFWTGETIDDLYIVEKEFLDDMERLNTFDAVTFRINSVGGDADAGIAIFNKIRDMDAKITTVVDGLAASAASVIFMAGDERKMNVGSQIMVHGASTVLLGYYNANELKGVLKGLNGYDDSLASIYADRTGQPKEAMARLIQNTTWMSAQDAIDKGFADEILNASEPVAAHVKGYDDMIMVNGNPLRLAPNMIPAMNFAAKAVSPDMVFCGKGSLNIKSDVSTEKEVEFMDIKTLKAQYPDLVDAIAKEAAEAAQSERDEAVASAVLAERERIRGIEAIQNRVSDKALVENAKYGETVMDAKELAFEAMKAETDIDAKALEAMDADAQASGTEEVTPEPVSGSEAETRKQDVADGAALLAEAFNKR